MTVSLRKGMLQGALRRALVTTLLLTTCAMCFHEIRALDEEVPVVSMARGFDADSHCAACKVIVSKLFEMVEESAANAEQEFIATGSFRVSPDGKQRGIKHIPFVRSEVHVASVLESACKKVPTGLRAARKSDGTFLAFVQSNATEESEQQEEEAADDGEQTKQTIDKRPKDESTLAPTISDGSKELQDAVDSDPAERVDASAWDAPTSSGDSDPDSLSSSSGSESDLSETSAGSDQSSAESSSDDDENASSLLAEADGARQLSDEVLVRRLRFVCENMLDEFEEMLLRELQRKVNDIPQEAHRLCARQLRMCTESAATESENRAEL
mmetsp:Transcript_3133/g.8735  ORF Transcript_3133/g.8735 Transcript_3133/m.8735 type:complete len:327 (-) Transcript_3133:1358-2338(-)